MQEFDFSKYGAFFAFSDEQFDEKKQEGIEYISLQNIGIYGLIAPQDKAEQMIIDFKAHNKSEREKRLEVDGLDKIIEYELSNYECYYTRDITDVLFLIEGYGTTQEYIREIFNKTKHKYED